MFSSLWINVQSDQANLLYFNTHCYFRLKYHWQILLFFPIPINPTYSWEMIPSSQSHYLKKGSLFRSFRSLNTHHDLRSDHLQVICEHQSYIKGTTLKCTQWVTQWRQSNTVQCHPSTLGLISHHVTATVKNITHRGERQQLPTPTTLSCTYSTPYSVLAFTCNVNNCHHQHSFLFHYSTYPCNSNLTSTLYTH